MYFPIPVIFLVLFALGLGFFCSAVNVFFRDVSHIVQILLSAWFYMSGIIFPIDVISEEYQFLLKINPMLYIIDGFHHAIYYGTPLDMRSMAISCICSLAVFVAGYMIFRRHQDTFIYYL